MDVVPELLVRPRGLVKILGLDLQKPAGHPHQEVWAALTQGRNAESVPLSYQVVQNATTVFPTRKTKEKQNTNVTDDDVVPLGIIKSNWVNKHRNSIPSVVVIFFDLDWQAEDWPTHEAACAKTINELRNAMDGRLTRLVAVLMLQNPLEDGHTLVEERAVSLRNACLLKTKSSLFALPSTDSDLREMVVRLESAFFELSNKYYEQAEVHVRKQMEALNMQTQTILAVRYNFKIAYFNELRQLRQAALKAYSLAYNTLKDSQATGVPLSEVKSVEGILNAKICQLQFGMQTPVDALKQFRDHLQTYRNRDGGKKALAFRHSAWLCEQYFMFAIVFEEAVRGGLTALQTEHPGFYFFQAAQHSRLQKEAAEIQLKELESIKAKIEIKESGYIGQSLIEVTEISDENAVAADKELFQLLMGERVHNHAQTIVNLCGRAVDQFKKLKTGKPRLLAKTERSVNRINIFCAEFDFELGRFEEAKEAVEKGIVMFRTEQWSQLLATTLLLAHRVAFQLSDAHAIAAYSMELAGGVAGCIDDEARKFSFDNLEKVVSGGIPLPLKSTAENESVKWSIPEPNTLAEKSLSMNDLKSCIDCKVCFEKKNVLANEDVVLVVMFQSSLPQPMNITDITPVFANAEYADVNVNVVEELTCLDPSKTGVLKMQLRTCLTTSHTLQCESISFKIGSGDNKLTLSWDVKTVISAALRVKLYDGGLLSESVLAKLIWEDTPNLSQLKIKQLPACVAITFDHLKPALVNEVYTVQVNIKSNEVLQMNQVKLKVRISEKAELCTNANILEGAEKIGNEQSYDLDSIDVDGLSTKEIQLQFTSACTVMLAVELQYYTATAVEGDDGHWERNTSLEEALDVVFPITPTFALESLQRVELPRATTGNDQNQQRPQQTYAGDSFLMRIELTSNVLWPIEVTKLEFFVKGQETSDGYPFSNHPLASFASTEDVSITILPSEVFSDCCCIEIPSTWIPRGLISLGELRASWKRADTDMDSTQSTHDLPSVNVGTRDISIEVEVAPHGHIRKPTVVTYTLRNHSAFIQDIQIQVDQSKTFLYSGAQRAIVKVLPGSMDADGRVSVSEKKISYNVFPLIGGTLSLPTMHVKSIRTGEVIASIGGPRSVFVKDNCREAKDVVKVDDTPC